LKETLAFGIVFLFIGVAFAPSLYADVKTISEQKELIEIPIQICGLREIKEYTVKLSKEDANRLDILFEDIHRRLNASESRKETISIFKDAVVELDKLGLLIDITVEDAQKLVIGNYETPQIINILRNLYANKFENKIDNSFCQVVGSSTKTNIYGWLLSTFYNIVNHFFPFYFIYMWYYLLISHFNRTTSFLGILTFGDWISEWEGIPTDEPAVGWIWTDGLNGIQEWNGSFYGNYYDICWDANGLYDIHEMAGASGFTGIKVEDFYLGYALRVRISDTCS